jgi:hypothetical protein
LIIESSLQIWIYRTEATVLWKKHWGNTGISRETWNSGYINT